MINKQLIEKIIVGIYILLLKIILVIFFIPNGSYE